MFGRQRSVFGTVLVTSRGLDVGSAGQMQFVTDNARLRRSRRRHVTIHGFRAARPPARRQTYVICVEFCLGHFRGVAGPVAALLLSLLIDDDTDGNHDARI